jgi:hypothetical protein
MDRTIKNGILHVDNASMATLPYLCSCGQRIEIPVENLVPDQQIDYHGSLWSKVVAVPAKTP